jgi:hypothetical protein
MKLSFRYYKTKTLIVTILALALGIDLGFEMIRAYLYQSGVFVLRAPTNTAIIASLLVWYDKYLWKYPILNKLVRVPNLNGRYAGYIEYERNGEKNRMDTVVEVIQTASKIQINTYFNSDNHENTYSKSLVEDIRSENGHYAIYFFYFNSGTNINDYLDCHEGANKLKVLMNGNEPRKLTGNYFTNRQEQTRGKIKVNFQSTDLKHEF